MDGSPRRPTSAAANSRQERRDAKSPYARRSPPPASTQSRLAGLLSFLSPFRSASRNKRPPSTLRQSSPEGSNVSADESMETVKDRESSLDIIGDAARHGNNTAREARPIKHHNSRFQLPGKSMSSPALYDMSSAFVTPQSKHTETSDIVGRAQKNEVQSSPRLRATQELARFFQEKADRGDEPLTAVEQAGVFQLMQQAQGVTLPTAFTPEFRSTSHSVMSTPAPGTSTMARNDSLPSTFRRRRPIYVGAGYSSQSARRRKLGGLATSLGDGGMTKSQSESALMEVSHTTELYPVPDGKRRRADNDALRQDTELSLPRQADPASRSSGPVLFILEPKPLSSSISGPTLSPNPDSLSAVAPPMRPSPLRQVMQPSTSSPSSPKKPSPIRPATSAADLVLDIIRQEDAARPRSIHSEVINPYESVNSPMARLPRSRPARPSTPRKTPTRFAREEILPSPKIALSPVQMLERTMPADLRHEDKRRRQDSAQLDTKRIPVEPAPRKPSPAPLQASKRLSDVGMLLLSDTDASGSEDEEIQAAPNVASTRKNATSPSFSNLASTSSSSADVLLPSSPPRKSDLPGGSESLAFTLENIKDPINKSKQQPPATESLLPQSSPFSRPAAPPPQDIPPISFERFYNHDDVRTLVMSKSTAELPGIDLGKALFESDPDIGDNAYQTLKDIVRLMAPSELPFIRL